MEGATKFEKRAETPAYNRESVEAEAMEQALDLLESRLSEGLAAAPAERLVALTDLMNEISDTANNDDRHTIEALAKLRRFAELELSFQTESKKLTEIVN